MTLRERKKQQTRDALSWAALRLVVERGLDAVLVEDIAAAAGVSPRTFNNYFSSKAEAITSRHVDRARRAADELRARPAGEPLWDAITEAALATVGGGDTTPDPEWTAGVRLMMAEPSLQAEFVKAGAVAEQELTLAIAERAGLDPVRDMYPRLVAATLGAAVLAAQAQWLVVEPPGPIRPLLLDALTQIRAGLPAPATPVISATPPT